MKFEKVSKTLSILMFAIFALLVSLGALAGVCNPSHKSYAIAFGIAAVLFAVLCGPGRKLKIIESFWLLTVLCLLVNGLWLAVFSIEPSVDFNVFWGYANQLASQYSAPSSYVAMFPHIFGYSWFLSLFLKLFGSSLWVPKIINLLLTTGSGMIIYTLVADVFDRRRAGIAFLLWILCPSKLIFNAMVLSEPYYTNLILLFVLIVEKLGKNGKAAWLSGLPAGLILALVNSARPIAAVPLIAFFIWMLLLGGYRKSFVPFSALLLAAYFAGCFAWNGYMESRLGEAPATGTPGYSVCVGINESSNGQHNGDDIDALFDYYYGQHLSAPEAQEKMLEQAKSTLAEGNIDFAKLAFNKIRALIGNDEAGAFYAKDALTDRQYSALAFVSNVYYYLLVLMALRGAFSAIKNRTQGVLQLAPLYVIGLVLAQMLVEVAGRYHYSIIPMLVITAAFYNRKERSV